MSPLCQCPQCGEPFAGAGGLCLPCRKKRAAPAEPSAPQPLLRPGDRFQELEILGLVGQGGMGVVYRARQIHLGRVVALKLIRPEKSESIDLQNRFEREAKVLASLQHPNIVQIFDLGRKDQLYYIVMEFVEGTTLRDRTRQGTTPPQEAVGIVEQVCRALEYAHGKGFVHRDIKPENILIAQDGQAKLTDFGLAKVLGNEERGQMLTQSGAVLGTMAYMAPEQWEGSPSVDGRADLYSTGAVLYELLTGKIPQGRIEDPTRGSSALGEVVLKSLERDPEKRYPSASVLRTDLLQSIAPLAETRLAPRAGPTKSRWRILAPVMILLVAGGGVAWHFTHRGTKEQEKPPSNASPIVSNRSPLETLQIGKSEGPRGENWGAGRARAIVHGQANPLLAQGENDLHILARYIKDSCPGLEVLVRSIRWGFLAQWNTLDYVVLETHGAARMEQDLRNRWKCEESWSDRNGDIIVLVIRYRGSSREAYEDLIRTAEGKLALLGRENE